MDIDFDSEDRILIKVESIQEFEKVIDWLPEYMKNELLWFGPGWYEIPEDWHEQENQGEEAQQQACRT